MRRIADCYSDKALNLPAPGATLHWLTRMLIDSGLQSLALVAQLHQVAVDPRQLVHRFAPAGGSCSASDLVGAARSLGFKAKLVNSSGEQLDDRILPAIGLARDGGFFVLARKAGDKAGSLQFLVQFPGGVKPQQLDLAGLESLWCGEIILLSPRDAGTQLPASSFNLRWFIPSLVKYRKLFTEVVIASFFLQLFALVTPLFFQVVMDKVLVHQGFTTLNVLAVGFACVVIFDAIIGGLRNYLFSHTSNRVDVELGARLFHHLSRLPLAYFEARQVGQTVARVRELDTIRNFITGTALTLLIDLSFTFVFLAVLWYYSPLLTWIVLGSLPFYVGLSVLITPMLKQRLDEKFRSGAVNQAFLTESVTGIHTVKAQALEPQLQRRWEEQLASYVSAAFRAQNLNNIASQIAGLISKITTLLIIWWGAHLVIAGALTVGQLVAFNMIAGRVTAPILKLVQLWQDFQQAGISMQRLGDILNTPMETGADSNRSTPEQLRGAVCFERVRFRYRADAPLAVDDISLTVAAGEVIAVVGRSGSGKSTLAKLLQRLYVPEGGRVLVDGADLAMLDTAWLRRNVGVVQQDSFLFNRTVRDNIALADPGASFERVLACARVAGAHDFVMELPEGYDTVLGEQGCNLSGGQRQRIALARALLGRPGILILDEATSALDYESERIVQENMGAISKGRTVFVIAHRLSTVRHCDRIVVIDKGRIVECGSHEQLLELNGYYARLHSYQNHSPRIRTLGPRHTGSPAGVTGR
jgi:subfamily B ATP-binding cassette protein HlyB/CyaB